MVKPKISSPDNDWFDYRPALWQQILGIKTFKEFKTLGIVAATGILTTGIVVAISRLRNKKAEE